MPFSGLELLAPNPAARFECIGHPDERVWYDAVGDRVNEARCFRLPAERIAPIQSQTGGRCGPEYSGRDAVRHRIQAAAHG